MVWRKQSLMNYFKNALWGLSVLSLAVLSFFTHTLLDVASNNLLSAQKQENIVNVASILLPTSEKINLLFKKEGNIKPYTNDNLFELRRNITDIIDAECETRQCEQYFDFSSQFFLGDPISNSFDAGLWFDKIKNTSQNGLIKKVESYYNFFFIHAVVASLVLLILAYRVLNIRTISFINCLLIVTFFAPIYVYFINIGGSRIDHLFINPISMFSYNAPNSDFKLYLILIVYVAIFYPIIFSYIKNQKIKIKDLII